MFFSPWVRVHTGPPAHSTPLLSCPCWSWPAATPRNSCPRSSPETPSSHWLSSDNTGFWLAVTWQYWLLIGPHPQTRRPAQAVHILVVTSHPLQHLEWRVLIGCQGEYTLLIGRHSPARCPGGWRWGRVRACSPGRPPRGCPDDTRLCTPSACRNYRSAHCYSPGQGHIRHKRGWDVLTRSQTVTIVPDSPPIRRRPGSA